MKEGVFIKQNVNQWEDFERKLKDPSKLSPDDLADLFIRITDDLSFARTQYPESETVQYLNNLASSVHHAIYKNKKEKSSRFITFWRDELPELLFEARPYLLYSFIIFGLSMFIGAVSAEHDDSYTRLIMSDNYVNMTLENIEKGDPMGVYKGDSQLNMFFGITFNNIRVSFFAFIMGIIIPTLGTGWILFRNGLMLGAFQYFFYQKGLLWTSFLTIWIHGTIEISSIVIAGSAGILVGNSLLFPGTYSRLTSFRKGAKKGLKIIIGLIPLFIIAGFLESFVTRLTGLPVVVKLAIILGSAFLIIYYFIYYPYKHHVRHEAKAED